MPCKWDRVFLDWLQKRGYKTRHDGEGQIHVCSGTVTISHGCFNHETEIYNWEIDAYYPGGTIIAIGRGCKRKLDLADPELFSKLGELFPVRSSGVSVDGCLRGFFARFLGSISSLVRACSRS